MFGLSGLALIGNAELVTNGSQLTVVNILGTTDTTIVGTGPGGNNTQLIARPTGGSNIAVIADNMTLSNGGELDVEGTEVHIRGLLDVDADSLITGRGEIVFTDTFGLNGKRIDLSGTLRPDINQTLTLTAESGTIDLDGSAAANNLVDVTNSGADLDINGPLHDAFSGRMDIGAGNSVGMSDAWTVGGKTGLPRRINFDANGGTGTLAGAPLTVGGPNFTGGGRIFANSGTGRITANVTLQSNANLVVAAGAELDLDGHVTFNGGTLENVNGTLDVGLTNTVNGATTIGEDGDHHGIIDLDAGDWNINDPLTLYVDAIDDNGPANTFNSRTMTITSGAIGGGPNGRLTVDLPNDEAWTLASTATLNINAPSGQFSALSVAGSDVNLNGSVNIDGNSIFSAAFDVGATGEVALADADSSFNIQADSQMSGGRISGPGQVRTSANSLVGHGTISADVRFTGTSQLWAEDSTLTVSGEIIDLGDVVGAANNGSVLNVTQPWDANLANEVVLNGGEVTGADLGNSGGTIRGFGRITSDFVDNHGLISAEGRTLELASEVNLDGSDFSGNDGDGRLRAVTGNILISSTVASGASFVGRMDIGAGHRVMYETGGSNDRLLFDDVTGDSDAIKTDFGQLFMTGGSLIADRIENQGEFDISVATSTIDATAIFFDQLGQTTIDSELRLNGVTHVETGATFDGSGLLVNSGKSEMRTADNAEIDVILVNEGLLVPGYGNNSGRLDLLDFQQEPSGVLDIELGGMDLDEFDRLIVSGNAQLDGALDVSLIDSFAPSLGDEFQILSAVGGVVGTFADENLPSFLSSGLMWNVLYDFNTVTLQVLEAFLAGDMDCDMDVDFDDIAAFVLGLNDPDGYENIYGVPPMLKGDIDGDGDLDFDDIDGFAGALSGSMSSGLQSEPEASSLQSIPEPTTLALMTLGVLGVLVTRRNSSRKGVSS